MASTATPTPTTPPQLRALVVGGIKSFVESNTAPMLMQYGMEVAWHWSMDRVVRVPTEPPTGCDVVVYLFEMVPHAHDHARRMKQTTRAAGVPFVMASRKKASLARDLEQAGFRVRKSAFVVGLERSADKLKEALQLLPAIPTHPAGRVLPAATAVPPAAPTAAPTTEEPTVKPTPVVQHKPHPAPATPRAFPEVMADLKRALRELRKDHGVATLIMDEHGDVEMSRRTTVHVSVEGE